MRWTPILLDVALVIAVWTAVFWQRRHLRARVVADHSPRKVRSYHLDSAALLCVAVGFTSFIAWLITDAVGPHWLHTLLEPAVVILIAMGAALSGCAAWIRAH